MQKGFWSKVIWIYCWTGAKCTVQPQIREWTTICQKKHTGWVTHPVCQPFQFNQSLIIEPYKCPPPGFYQIFFLPFASIAADSSLSPTLPHILQFELHFGAISQPPSPPSPSLNSHCLLESSIFPRLPWGERCNCPILANISQFFLCFFLSILVSQTKVRYSRRCQMVNPDVTDIWMWIFLRTFAPHGTFNSTYIYSFLVSAKSVKCICFGALLCR